MHENTILFSSADDSLIMKFILSASKQDTQLRTLLSINNL